MREGKAWKGRELLDKEAGGIVAGHRVLSLKFEVYLSLGSSVDWSY